MGIFGKAGKWLGRGASAVATGGASEAYRAATGKADPYTAYQERTGAALGGKVDSATGQGSGMPANPYDSETPDERKKRAQYEGDLAVTRYYRDRLANEHADPRAAVQVGAPRPIQSARVGTVAPIAGPGPIGFERVASTFDPSFDAEAQGLQRGYLSRVGDAMEGRAPSAAEIMARKGGAQAAALAGSLAAGHKGAGTAALRSAQTQGVKASQGAATDAAMIRAQEMASARSEYGNAVATVRGQDLGLAQTGADLDLRAATANQGAGLTAGIETAHGAIDVAKANQAARLQQNLTQAGLDQQAVLHMSDQQLQVALANAGFKLTQEQIDDLRAHNLRQAQLEANSQALGAGNAEAARNQRIKELRTQYAMAVQANDQKSQDAALSMLADLGAAYATGGTSLAGSGVSRGAVGPNPGDDTLPVRF